MNTKTIKDVQISARDILQMVPMKNEKVFVEREEADDVVLKVPLKKKWYNNPPLTWILPFSQYRRIGLDRLGVKVWKECDGSTNVERIVEQFSVNYKLTFHEARLTVTDFLRDLSKRGIIAVVKYTEEDNKVEKN